MHGGARNQKLATPWAWIRRIEGVLGRRFILDPCCEESTAKAPAYYTVTDDGLSLPWVGVVWCNPPFNDIGSWVAKGLREVAAHRAAAVVYVVPANRTDRPWWQTLRRMERDGLAWRAEVGERINYLGGPSSAPFPSTFWAVGDPSIASRIMLLEDEYQQDFFA